MKKLFKRIAPLLLALVMVLGSCLTVSASDDNPYSDIYNSYHKSGFDYFLVFDKGDSITYFFCDQPVYHQSVGNVYYITPTFDYHSYRVFYDKSKKTFSLSGDGSDLQNWKSIKIELMKGSSVELHSGGSLIYSNHDIFEIGANKETDEPFFRGPERPLVAAVQGASPEEALKEVILLIPLSILFLAGCLGLRKALRLLLTLLRRA